MPFVLNGTLYDPKDINRFDGQELHFAVAVSRDHMLAIDDLDVIGRWWQYIYLSSLTTRSPLEDYQYGATRLVSRQGP